MNWDRCGGATRHWLLAAAAINWFTLAPDAADAQLPLWRLEQNLRVGSVEGPAALSRIADVIVQPQTRYMFVAQPLENTIKVFDSSGRLIRTIGRSGAGPGEFQGGLGHLGFRADTLYAIDAANQRVTLFSLDGRVHHSSRLVAPPPQAYSGAPVPIGLLANGRFLARPQPARHAALDSTLTVPLVSYDREGRLLSRFTDLKEGGTLGTLRTERGSGLFWQPLAASPLTSVAQDGAFVIAVHREPTRSGPRHSFRVQKFSPDGRSIYDRTYAYHPTPVPPSVIDSIRAKWISDLGSQLLSPPAAARAARELLRIPPHEPTVSSVATSLSGEVWLRREFVRKSQVEYLILDVRGTPVARAVVPAAVVIRRIVGDEAYAIMADDFGIPFLVRYRIRR